MVFMLQKEVVDRMGAGPGSKVYGRLSVMLQAYCQVQPLFVVPPGAFRPAPKVDSAVVRLVPRDPATVGIDDPARFADVVRAAFGQRRKTLRNALNGSATASSSRPPASTRNCAPSRSTCRRSSAWRRRRAPNRTMANGTAEAPEGLAPKVGVP